MGTYYIVEAINNKAVISSDGDDKIRTMKSLVRDIILFSNFIA